jgi:hypothetical protein
LTSRIHCVVIIELYSFIKYNSIFIVKRLRYKTKIVIFI